MALVNNTRTLTGPVPKELHERGLLGRGLIVSIQQTSVSTGADFDPSHVCVFTVEVSLDNEPRYTGTCRQAVWATVLPQLMLPNAAIAVRVDPNDHSRIALSLGEEPPAVTIASSGDPNAAPADAILADGTPCKAVIVQSQPMGMRSSTGSDMYAFVLTVIADDEPQYQTQVGNPVPAEAVRLLYPGNTVPAKRVADGRGEQIVIDWDAALAQAESPIA